MAHASEQPSSLRFSRPETERLVLALVFSLLAHLGAWGGYEAGKQFGWWQHLPSSAWWHRAEKKNPLPPPPPQNPPVTINMTFLPDVSHPEAEPPPQAKYYSSKNSRAANPDASADTDTPKLTGAQKDIPKTEDTPKFTKLQPSAPPPEPPAAQAAQATPEAEPSKPRGDLEIVKKTSPDSAPEKPKITPPPERPRTVKQALAQRAVQQLPGQQLKQEGGVRRQRLWSSLDAKATPFGEYDRAVVEAVQQRWYDLLDSQQFAKDRTGKVTLHFKLLTDGRIIEVKLVDDGSNVGPLLCYVCQEAVEQAAPFGKWPPDMIRMIGANFREITFTFYYY